MDNYFKQKIVLLVNNNNNNVKIKRLHFNTTYLYIFHFFVTYLIFFTTYFG